MLRNSAVASLLLAGFSATAYACLWDNDTLQMERLRFPGVLEIITGKFVRHSQAYYEWRIVNRKQKLQTNPDDPALIDDLAVAYAKLGRPEEGIAILEPTLATHPDRYETLSNLGTLLFFAGRLDESKDCIRRAIEINPDAHFGRERYQLLLTEYLQQTDHAKTGVMRGGNKSGELVDFAHFVASRQSKVGDQGADATSDRSSDDPGNQIKEIRLATKGVLGMMHFADFKSPILLEALGDLLSVGWPDENLTQLAARAYLRAAQFSDEQSAAHEFHELAREALRSHGDFGMHRDGVDLSNLERQLAKEVAAADAWFSSIAANEHRWITENSDVDREFASAYYDSLETTLATADKKVRSEWRLPRPSYLDRLLIKAFGLFCALPLAIIVSITVAWRWRRRVARRKTGGKLAAISKLNA